MAQEIEVAEANFLCFRFIRNQVDIFHVVDEEVLPIELRYQIDLLAQLVVL